MHTVHHDADVMSNKKKQRENSSFFCFNAEVLQEVFVKTNTLNRNVKNCPILHSAMDACFPAPQQNFQEQKGRKTHISVLQHFLTRQVVRF